MGTATTVRTNARVIAATNKDLQKEVNEKRFRDDLWYRLNVFPIRVPPLRERSEDIPLLIRYLIDKHEKRIGKCFRPVPQKTIDALQNYSWPGNIRELENFIERAVITNTGGNLELEIPSSSQQRDLLAEKVKLRELERECFLDTLARTGWRVEGPRGAASVMGFTPSSFRRCLRRLSIRRPGNP